MKRNDPCTLLRELAEPVSLPSPSRVVEDLERLAAATGDPAFARAARALRQGTSPGRPAIDDQAMIAEAEWLFATGRTSSLNGAFRRVALAYEPDKRQRSVAERLRQKYLGRSSKE